MSYSFARGQSVAPQKLDVPEIPIVPILIHYGFDEYELKDYPHGWFKVRCAFHGETNPSASYSTELNGFNCHACGVSGDAIKIVQSQEGCEFPEALRKACELAGVDPSGVPVQATEQKLKVKRVSASSVMQGLNVGAKGAALKRKRGGISLS